MDILVVGQEDVLRIQRRDHRHGYDRYRRFPLKDDLLVMGIVEDGGRGYPSRHSGADGFPIIFMAGLNATTPQSVFERAIAEYKATPEDRFLRSSPWLLKILPGLDDHYDIHPQSCLTQSVQGEELMLSWEITQPEKILTIGNEIQNRYAARQQRG